MMVTPLSSQVLRPLHAIPTQYATVLSLSRASAALVSPWWP
jgi:hypothetical protein